MNLNATLLPGINYVVYRTTSRTNLVVVGANGGKSHFIVATASFALLSVIPKRLIYSSTTPRRKTLNRRSIDDDG
jgi:hypothetical protein